MFIKSPSRHKVALVVCGLVAACSGQENFAPPPRGVEWLMWTALGSVSGQPATDGAYVYYGTRDHLVVAVRRETGAVRWQSRTDPTTPGTLFGENIVLAAGNVIFGDYWIYAFDAATGTRKWVFNTQAQGIPGHAPGAYELASDGTTIYAGSGSGHVYAIAAADGALVWINPLAVDGHTSIFDPVIDGPRIYVTVRHFTNPITGAVFALNRNDGTVIWSHVVPPDARTSTGPHPKVVVFASTVIVANDNGKVYALDKNTGATQWVAPRRPDVIGYNDQRPIVLTGEVLVAGSLADYLTGYDAATGRQGSAPFSLATDGVTVFVPYPNGVLVAFDAATGSQRWHRSAPDDGYFTPYPLVTNDAIYAPSTRGLVALKK